MSKTLENYDLGPAGTPHEVKQLRESSYDLHNQLGEAIIFKHRWNDQDVLDGKTQPCPYHDELYGGRDSEWDNVCFGTGFVGGYSDGVVVFVTIQDAPETQIKITQQGILQLDMHPAMTAPWLPHMGNGDLIITGEFNTGSWTLVDEYERFTLRDVSPITMRGPGWGRQAGSVLKRERISQQSQLDKLPSGHPLYKVPIVFDYSSVPPDVTPPYAPPGTTQYTDFDVLVRIHGIEGVPEVIEGTTTVTQVTSKIGGKSLDPGTIINF